MVIARRGDGSRGSLLSGLQPVGRQKRIKLTGREWASGRLWGYARNRDGLATLVQKRNILLEMYKMSEKRFKELPTWMRAWKERSFSRVLFW